MFCSQKLDDEDEKKLKKMSQKCNKREDSKQKREFETKEKNRGSSFDQNVRSLRLQFTFTQNKNTEDGSIVALILTLNLG